MAEAAPAADGGNQVATLCVLGSISINLDGRRVDVGGAKPRRLLGALILYRNAVVTTERLVEVVWGDDAPESAVPTLQAYVSRLRRLLPSSARLVSRAPGYQLSVEPATTDVDRFETTLARGWSSWSARPSGRWPCWTRRWPSGAATRSPSSPTSGGRWPRWPGWPSCASMPASRE